ncbi:MAG: MFS transporter [Chloroflexi bacterium]|nr:MFS transporter [Chloroflexota bacterium]
MIGSTRAVAARLGAILPAPIRRAMFRRLWLSMGTSYAGDRLQDLAQSWLVATVTSSALAVGGIRALGSLPLLLMPIGGVIADALDRRRLLIAGQLAGAALTAGVAALVLLGRVTVWHIYAWVVLNSFIWVISRPSYKVVLTESVPLPEVRSAVAINSMTEMAVAVLVSGAGGVLLGTLGLSIAFTLNSGTYLLAALALWSLRGLRSQSDPTPMGLDMRRVLSDLAEGFRYLMREPRLLHPLLFTVLILAAISPAIGLSAAIVHAAEGSVVDYGVLMASAGLGAFLGAAFAGARRDGGNATYRYAILGLVASAALAAFALLPIEYASLLPLATIGFVVFVQAVWNTSRVRAVADAAHQARLQAITSTVFNVGFPIGMLWGGLAVDRFGVRALLGGAVVLAAVSGIMALVMRHSGHSGPGSLEKPEP